MTSSINLTLLVFIRYFLERVVREQNVFVACITIASSVQDSCCVTNVVPIRYFLGLFPVFALSTNFPIISVTLRNNLKVTTRLSVCRLQ